MRDTRLVLVEGQPGSGKSTTAGWLAGELEARGHRVRCLLEESADHPLHVGGSDFPGIRNTGEAFFASYTVERCEAETLARWRAFIDEAATSSAVQVVECYPYQAVARVLLQLDAPTERILAHDAALLRIARRFAPVLVFFEQPDPIGALRATCEQRGPEWTDFLVAIATGSPGARRQCLAGWEGTLEAIRTYHELLARLVEAADLPKLVLPSCAGRWPECRAQIEEFLELD